MDREQLFAWLQYPIPHHALSRLIGRVADSRQPWIRDTFIRRFASHYNVDMSQAEQPDLGAYENFNAFFTRALKPEARPLGDGILSPADGVLSQFGAIKHGTLIQAKGHAYSLTALLGGDEARAEPLRRGRFATVYLSPRDYHRVHMPCTGTLRETVYVPGRLFSVNQATTRQVPALFARNERLVCHFDTEHGPMALVLIGAMIVAAIETVWAGRITPIPRQPRHTPFDAQSVTLERGAEMGRFMLGSSVVMCFPESIEFNEPLTPGQMVSMGQSLATPKS